MFEALDQLPPDPILGVMAAYRADPNPAKVDLSVGVYRDEDGHTPILACVEEAQARYTRSEDTKSYIAQPGVPGSNEAIRELLFGSDHPALQSDRVRTVQAPGGCGALRVAAELINRSNPNAVMWVTMPTWANHLPLLGSAGIQLKEFPYYDYDDHTIRFDEMMATLSTIAPGELVLFHACCHNPCGADLNPAQWDAIAALAAERGFTPFVDIAYQGLGNGLDQDAYGLRVLAEKVPELIVASSCSKNFGLYRERVGAISVIATTPARADVIHSQILNIARGLYSMPPSHGSGIVMTILTDTDLRADWIQEITAMRDRLNDLRETFAAKMREKNSPRRFDFIEDERGLFSFLGITKKQIHTLREEYSIYMVESSRINIAGISHKNVDYVTDALLSVL